MQDFSREGALIKNALDWLDALRMGVQIPDIPADEFFAMRVIEEERSRFEQEEREKERDAVQ